MIDYSILSLETQRLNKKLLFAITILMNNGTTKTWLVTIQYADNGKLVSIKYLESQNLKLVNTSLFKTNLRSSLKLCGNWM